MIYLGGKTHAVSVIEIALIVRIQSGNDDELRSRIVAVLAFKPSDNVMHRPSCGNMQFLTLITDLTLTKVGGVGLPQLVQAFLTQSNLNTTYKVIAVKQSSSTIQTCVARTDGGKFKGLESFGVSQINAAIFRVGTAYIHIRENVMPQVFTILVEDAQTFVIYTANEGITMATRQHGLVWNLTRKPRQEENCQRGLAYARRKTDRQKVKRVICKSLKLINHRFQNLTAGSIEFLRWFTIPLDIQ